MTDYQVVLLRYGRRQTTRSGVYLNYHLYHEADGPIGMDYFIWVIRNSDHTVLVDTGFSDSGGSKRSRTQLMPPAEGYAELGIDPRGSPPIIVTHAHYDHIGNLSLFPSSPIVMAAAEHAFWRGSIAKQAQFRHSVEEDDLRYLTRAHGEGRVTTFADQYSVAPGIEVFRVGGHTPGQSIVKVDTDEGPVLLASDAVHYFEEYERRMPFVSAANLVDMYAAFDRIEQMVRRGEVTHIVSGHDPETLHRFRPLPGALSDHAAVIGSLW